MELYYCPSFNNLTYIDYAQHGGMLWNAAAVSTNALLDQLLLRLGLTQTPAEESENATKMREEAFKKTLTGQWMEDSLSVDPEGTVKQLLAWRDCLVMEGWDSTKTQNAKSQKLASLSQWESSFDKMAFPG
ncbi:MAG: hypothetical protein MJZ49_08855, partial [Bacteroidales bacterium]|nr:hypothetical protein [Bacteroidales bacterium]